MGLKISKSKTQFKVFQQTAKRLELRALIQHNAAIVDVKQRREQKIAISNRFLKMAKELNRTVNFYNNTAAVAVAKREKQGLSNNS